MPLFVSGHERDRRHRQEHTDAGIYNTQFGYELGQILNHTRDGKMFETKFRVFGAEHTGGDGHDCAIPPVRPTFGQTQSENDNVAGFKQPANGA